jgi:anti-anti-sigma factor
LRLEAILPSPELGAVVFAGRIDAAAGLDLRSFLDGTAFATSRILVLDLTAVDFIDSAGLAILVRERRRCRERGGDVFLVRPKARVASRIFELTQFDQVFHIVDARAAQA